MGAWFGPAVDSKYVYVYLYLNLSTLMPWYFHTISDVAIKHTREERGE